jgi:flagellar biosynthesis anti-sigma factor FlgM
MQIRETNAAVIARTYTRQAGTASDSSAPGRVGAAGSGVRRSRTDSLAFSSTFQQVADLRDQVAGQPEVRGDLVASLQAQIAAGTYHVDTTQLAQTLLGVK